MPNTNCLEDFECYVCGNTESFRIVVSGWADVTDDGATPDGSTFWDGNSKCKCSSCGEFGIVDDFNDAEARADEVDPLD